MTKAKTAEPAATLVPTGTLGDRRVAVRGEGDERVFVCVECRAATRPDAAEFAAHTCTPAPGPPRKRTGGGASTTTDDAGGSPEGEA